MNQIKIGKFISECRKMYENMIGFSSTISFLILIFVTSFLKNSESK